MGNSILTGGSTRVDHHFVTLLQCTLDFATNTLPCWVCVNHFCSRLKKRCLLGTLHERKDNKTTKKQPCWENSQMHEMTACAATSGYTHNQTNMAASPIGPTPRAKHVACFCQKSVSRR